MKLPFLLTLALATRLCGFTLPPISIPSPPPTTSPSPVASPTPVPSVAPTPEPSPEATPSPVATPTPQPTPTPEPSPSVEKCVPQPLPDTPVRMVTSGPVPKWMVCDSYNNQRICVGRTDRTGENFHHADDEDDCLWGVMWLLKKGSTIKDGMLYDDLRGYTDAYCRRVGGSKLPWDPTKLTYPPMSPDHWGYNSNRPPDFCYDYPPSPVPTPIPAPPGVSDVNKLLILNYGKCVLKHPFVFYLDTDCKELLITATPKAATTCDGKACDAEHHGRDLKWHVEKGTGDIQGGPYPIPDTGEDVDINGCATVSAGPVEMTFNRRIVGTHSCKFDLVADLIAPDGKAFHAVAHVSIE